jgi:ADP-ribose pyrophosphatase YjhB (NUDIX family)
MTGRVDAIFTAAAEALPVRRRTRVMARPGIGLDGDRYATGNGYWSGDTKVSRDLTIIEAEAIRDVAAELDVDLELGALRRNIVTRGVALNDLVGTRFWVGDVLVEATSLCEPCAHVARLAGAPILRPFVHRGGLRANILTVGEIEEGAAIELVAPQVGVGVVVRRDGRYLLGLRKGRTGSGSWSTPGGAVRSAETVLACAVRELQEETGLEAVHPRVVAQSVDTLDDGSRWHSIFVSVDVQPGSEPRLLEPDKCQRWGWFAPGLLPQPLFAPVAMLMSPGGFSS